MPTRQYVEAIAAFLEKLVMERYQIPLQIPPPHVGIYPSSTTKVASIGIQIRHRITSHGFALNVTDDVKYWFDQIIACGAPDIKATSIESELRKLGKEPFKRFEVEDVVPEAVAHLRRHSRGSSSLLTVQSMPSCIVFSRKVSLLDYTNNPSPFVPRLFNSIFALLAPN